MTTELMTAPKSATTKKPCDCGCSGGSGGSECCELECLVQPRFFCGQLLADQDLTAMVDWVKAKSALQRFRDGWGVVCGLDVQCGRGGNVTVTPGYAIDCCGRDIVICKEASFKASDCWQRDPDPCGPDAVKKTGQPGQVGGVVAQAFWTDGGGGGPATTNNDIDFEWPEDIQAVDIFVRYSESQSGARSTLSRGTSCGGGCEYTRVDEGGELYCRPAKGCAPPEDSLVKWNEEYAEESRRMTKALTDAASTNDFDVFKEHVRRHGLHTFCYINEWLCDVERRFKNLPLDPKGQKPNKPDEATTASLLTIARWILQDWRNHRLIRPCTSCGSESGVRLARVFLARKLNGGKESFTTLYVSAASPFRRLLARDQSPVVEGSVNLAPFIWQPVPLVRQSLLELGVNVHFADTTSDDIARFDNLVFPATAFVDAHTMTDPCFVERVSFFSHRPKDSVTQTP